MGKPRRSVSEVEKELKELKEAFRSLKALYEHESTVLKTEIEQKVIVDTELHVLKAAIEQSPVTTIITNLDGIITFVNPKFTQTTGYSFDEAIGQNIKILRGDVVPHTEYSTIWETILAGNSWSGILNTRKKNGELYWESVVISPVKDSTNKISHLLFIKEDITAKKLAEIELQTTNANLLALLENTSETIWSVDSNYRIIQLNSVFVQSFNMFYGVLLSAGMNILDALPKELRIKWKDHYDKALNNSHFVFEEVFHLEANTLYVEVAMSPIIVNNEVVGVTVFSRNVTPYRQAQVDLARSNRFLDTVINEMPNMVFIKDAKELRFVRLNKAGETILGVSKDDFIGKSDYDIFPKELADDFTAADLKTLQSGIMVEIPFEPVETSFGIRYLHTRKVPIANELGVAEFLLGISDDITDKLKSDADLKLSEERYHLLADVTIEGVAIVKDGYIVDCNNALLRLIDTNEVSYLLNRSIVDIIAQDDIHLWHSMVSSNLTARFEVRLIKCSGELISCEMESRLHSGGGIDYRVVAFRDVTDRKNAEKTLEISNNALLVANADKDRFIAILGHDLRSPFNALLGFSRLLVENVRELDIDTIETYVTHLNNTAENTYNLLEDILIWATLKTGNAPFQPKEISLSELTYYVFDSLNALAMAKEIKLDILMENNCVVFADANMLKTVLRNLLSNAIKFSHKGGVVSVDAKRTTHGMEIVINDTGVGMTKELTDSLFNTTKIHSTIGTAGEKGTGLGLVLCKEFIEKHGGKIWAVSELGKGAMFAFLLPSNH